MEIGAQESGCGFSKTIEKGHGRLEEREIWVISNLEWLEKVKEPLINCFARDSGQKRRKS